MNRLKAIFHIFCVVTAAALIFWKIYEYCYSQYDRIKINFQRFNNDQQTPYPSLTLCFYGIIDPNLNDTSHQNLLRKDLFRSGSNQTILKVEEYIEKISTKDFDGNTLHEK